jgi:hypothetical protein
MNSTKKSVKYQQSQLYRSLVTIALLMNGFGFFQLISPALAEGTTAGQSISNTATASYEDPNSPGTTINTTSNTVTVSVAEVAGITVTASGVTDNNGGTVGVNDVLTYTYTLTNVGNDPTRFRIPNQASTTGPGSVSGVLPPDKNGDIAVSGQLQYSTDGGATWTNVTPGGLDSPSVPVNGTVLVRVPVTVQPGAQPNDIITVTLGNTPGNAQNQLLQSDGGDVFTVDNANGDATGEVDGAPVNGSREASATQQITVNSTIKTYSLATLLKTKIAYSTNNTNQINDDLLTYGLSLRVESSDPTGNSITTAPLVGSTININTPPSDRILISDAIPLGTVLAAVPTAPPGWIPVYSTLVAEDPASSSTKANAATWTTIAPSDLTTVKRVGFVNNPDVITSVAPGTTVIGFSIQVRTTGAPNTAGNDSFIVDNIAQVFGKTPGTNAPVYDESGDSNPSNFADNGNWLDGTKNPPTSATNLTPLISDGYINDPTDRTNTGIDPGNNNTGSDGGANTGGGEANSFTITEQSNLAVLNGPQNAPDAVGPTDNNDDFTNKSSLIPAGTAPGSKVDPQSVGFTNTVRNNGLNAGNITIEPTTPANKLDLPDGTKVTITYNGTSAVYTYDQTAGVFNIAANTTPITATNVASNTSINYGVEIDLPNTALSTDTLPDYPGDKEFGYPVPIKSTITANEASASNITIDRVYTGFLKLVKLSRIIQNTGPVVGQGQDDFESTPAYTNPITNTVIDPNPTVNDVLRKPAPGNVIEYQIRYKNISDPQAGSGNVILNADKIVITEDGTAGGNNWAVDNDGNGTIDTSNVTTSAKDSGASTIQFFNGNPPTNLGNDQTGTTATTDVTKYVDTVTGQVAPGIQRTFTFQRKVN